MLVTSASGALVLVVLIAARRARRLAFALLAFTAGLLVGTATGTFQTLFTHTLTRL